MQECRSDASLSSVDDSDDYDASSTFVCTPTLLPSTLLSIVYTPATPLPAKVESLIKHHSVAISIQRLRQFVNVEAACRCINYILIDATFAIQRIRLS